MRFDFFDGLSRDEAKAFLERFLSLESAHLKEVLKQCSTEGVDANFGTHSVAPFMRWLVTKLKTIPQAPDSQVPVWIRETDSYVKNLFEFDDASKLLTLRAAYYLGEAFVRNHPRLLWAIGNPETAEANMPVVTGFQANLEMAPILVADNLFRRVISDPGKLADIEKAIEYWRQKV